MTKHATTCWSYIAGEKGRNRVRAFQRGAVITLDYRLEDGRRVSQTLGHNDRDLAKQKADALAAKFASATSRPVGVLTLRALFDTYLKEKTPGKSSSAQGHDRRALVLFLKAFGSDRRPSTLSVRDWTSFIDRRRRGELAYKRRKGKTVRNEIIRQDLKTLLAVLNWAERARDDRGEFLLDKNPLRGLELPIEAEPQRPVLSAEQFATVREKAAELSSLAELFVLVLWFSGHRAASVRQLRWDDVDVEGKAVVWRADVDKMAFRHANPLHPELLRPLADAKAIADLTGSGAWVFPCPRDGAKPMNRMDAATMWRKIADAAGIKVGSRIGTHSFRRAFANRLRNAPLKELVNLGGWKTERTVVGTYLQPDQNAQRAVLEALE